MRQRRTALLLCVLLAVILGTVLNAKMLEVVMLCFPQGVEDALRLCVGRVRAAGPSETWKARVASSQTSHHRSFHRTPLSPTHSTPTRCSRMSSTQYHPTSYKLTVSLQLRMLWTVDGMFMTNSKAPDKRPASSQASFVVCGLETCIELTGLREPCRWMQGSTDRHGHAR
jgi:hypothetical protein